MRTVSLELARQLKEAGYPQEEQLFYWTNSFNHTQYGLTHAVAIGSDGFNCYPEWELSDVMVTEGFASPTADEILDQLPEIINGYKAIEIGKYADKYVIRYQLIDNSLLGIRFDDEFLVDAAAQCWLYLKKENLLK